LITILIVFLINQYKMKAKKRSRANQLQFGGDSALAPNSEAPVSEKAGTAIITSQSTYMATKDASKNGIQGLSVSSKPPLGNKHSQQQNSHVSNTSLSWDPTNPPKPPSLKSWLKRQEGVSPFGSIKLPEDSESSSPLGGQLKSPLQSSEKPFSPLPQRFTSDLPLRNPKSSVFMSKRPSVDAGSVQNPMLQYDSVKRKPISPGNANKLLESPVPKQSYRDSQDSVWTDAVTDEGPSPMLPRQPEVPTETASIIQGYTMRIPSPRGPVRDTAEWLQEGATFRSPNPTQNLANSRPASNVLPKSPRAPKLGIVARPYVIGIRKSRGEKSQTNTPGVGRAL
jgi:hypothetical protein